MDDDMPAHYSRALDEIYRLRCALVFEALVIDAHLDFQTFPKSRRGIAHEQMDRMRRAARGETQEAYSEISSGVLQGLLVSAGAHPTLTRAHWEEGGSR